MQLSAKTVFADLKRVFRRCIEKLRFVIDFLCFARGRRAMNMINPPCSCCESQVQWCLMLILLLYLLLIQLTLRKVQLIKIICSDTFLLKWRIGIFPLLSHGIQIARDNCYLVFRWLK